MQHRSLLLLVLVGLLLPACGSSYGTNGGGNGGADPLAPGGGSDPGGGAAGAGGTGPDAAATAKGESGALFYTSAGTLRRRDLATKQEITVRLDVESSEFFGYGGGVFTEYVTQYADRESFDFTLHRFDGTKFTQQTLPTITLPHGRITSMLQPSPDASRYLLASIEDDIAYVRVIDGMLAVKTKIQGFRIPIWISPHSIAMVSGDGIYVADLDAGATPKQIGKPMGTSISDMAISPDGQTIAFEASDTIYRMGIDGSGLLQLTLQRVEERWPTWSPDGSSLLLQYGGDCSGLSAKVIVISASVPNQDVVAATSIGVFGCGPMRWL